MPDTGQSVEFVYNMPLAWSPSGAASPWPTIGVSGNTITWNFSTGASSRISVPILAVTY